MQGPRSSRLAEQAPVHSGLQLPALIYQPHMAPSGRCTEGPTRRERLAIQVLHNREVADGLGGVPFRTRGCPVCSYSGEVHHACGHNLHCTPLQAMETLHVCLLRQHC